MACIPFSQTGPKLFYLIWPKAQRGQKTRHCTILNHLTAMRETSNARLTRPLELAIGSLTPPAGKRRIIAAVSYGCVCLFIFLLAALSMMSAMFFGMSKSLGGVPPPWKIAPKLALILQCPLAHSIFLTKPGRTILAKPAPSGYGATMATTTSAIIASIQLLALFVFWTPSGAIWWQAQNWRVSRWSMP